MYIVIRWGSRNRNTRRVIYAEVTPDEGLLKLIEEWSSCLNYAYIEFEEGKRFEEIRCLAKQKFQYLDTRQISDAVYIAKHRRIKQRKIGIGQEMWARGDKVLQGNPTFRIIRNGDDYILKAKIERRQFRNYRIISQERFMKDFDGLIKSKIAYNVFLKYKLSDGIEKDNSNLLVACEICGRKFKRIAGIHLFKHGMTFSEYRKLFPMAEISSQLWKNKLKITATGRKFPKDVRNKLSIAKKNNWADPVYRDRQLKAWKSALTIHPNKPEKLLQQVLDELQPGEWKFNDGWFILAGKMPDFVNVNGRKYLIDLFGTYWHEKDEERERIDLFRQYGYETLVVWEDELKDMPSLVNKVRNYIGVYSTS